MAIYEQQETNAKTVGLSYTSITIAVWSIVLAAFLKVIHDALKVICNTLKARIKVFKKYWNKKRMLPKIEKLKPKH